LHFINTLFILFNYQDVILQTFLLLSGNIETKAVPFYCYNKDCFPLDLVMFFITRGVVQ